MESNKITEENIQELRNNLNRYKCEIGKTREQRKTMKVINV
jgi:hypothetical protein